MIPPKGTRDLARSLIAREADTGTASPQIEPATVRVYDRLRRQFSAPVGVDGFEVLASRALARVYRPRPIEAGFPRAKILSRPHLERV
jgi:hypothetical protein